MEQTNGFAPCQAAWLPVPRITPRVAHPPVWFTMVVATVVSMLWCGQTAFSQCPLVCNGNLTVALNEDGVATIEPDMLLQNIPASCSGNFTINVTDTLGNNYGDEVDGALIGEPLTATITDDDSGNSCDSELAVIDNLPPEVDCEEVFIYCNVPSHPDSLGYPTINDNVSPYDSLNISFSDILTDLDCFTIEGDSVVTARIDRTWIAEDESGNADTCLQKIWFRRATLDMVEFPPNRDGFEAPPLECGTDDPNDLDLTGRPTINNYSLTNATDCELVTSYLDQEVPICGGEVKIIRNWHVFDVCTEESRIFVQIIRVNDTTPPEIECPQGVSFSTYTNSCLAQVWLPAANVSDMCSDVTVSEDWQFGSGQGPFNNVPPGDYEVSYTAVDDCGNQSACKVSILVEDDDPPSAICENQISITLQSDGTALIFAETFDDGSHDNCGIDYFLVSRDGNPFDDIVYFDCEDITGLVQVDLKVFDNEGLVNQCISNVSVEDDINPEILCPPTSNLDCGTDFSNTDLTGMPFATDNCNVGAVTFSDNINLDNCGIGMVLRTWTAADQSGNTTACTQTINLNDNTPLTIIFPDDVLTYECNPNTDPLVTGEPIITGADCEQLGIDYTDFEFYTAYPACYQLVRKWAIIEFCSFDPNTGEGFWEHTQIIEVEDSEAPVISCPGELTVGIDGGNACETFAQIPIPTVEDCSEEITITHNSLYAFSGSEDASGIYPKGEHTITFFASDGCGNTSQCSMKVVIVDTEPPNPVCNNGVSVTIQQNGYVTVTPAMIENGSWDNCSDYQALVMQVSPNTFNCQTLGNQTVTLTVTDQFGNSAFCQTTVVVQDNFEVCPAIDIATIAGKLKQANGDALSQKLVGLSGGVNMAMHTNVDGTYAFQSLPTEQAYLITPTYDTEPLNGVTTFDLVLMRKHILGITPFETPYEWIAADVNQSKSVTTFDMVELRKLILAIYDDFPDNTSWRFVDATYDFQNQNNPLQDNFPEAIEIDKLEGNIWEQNFIGVKIGDINGNANPENFNGNADDRSYVEELIINVLDVDLEPGFEYQIPFYAKDFKNIIGYQFALKFNINVLEFGGIEAGNLHRLSKNNFGLNKLEKGILTTSWEALPEQTLDENESLFTLKFIAKATGKLSENLSLNQGTMPAEAYAGSLHSNPYDSEMMNIFLEFENTQNQPFELFQNTPNPFTDYTLIQFYLPKATTATLTVHDLYGNELWQQTSDYPQGFHEVKIDLKHQNIQAGILLYQLNAQGFKPKTKKMVFLK